MLFQKSFSDERFEQLHADPLVEAPHSLRLLDRQSQPRHLDELRSHAIQEVPRRHPFDAHGRAPSDRERLLEVQQTMRHANCGKAGGYTGCEHAALPEFR
jgi:hypothetical protein